MDKEFELDARLDNDCVTLGDFELCRVLLMNDCQYPWLILVPRVAGATELYQLTEQQQQQAQQESSFVARKMAEHFDADKMNLGALGNIVKQLHLHHIARFESDKAWPGPVWGAFPAVAYSPNELEKVSSDLRELLGF